MTEENIKLDFNSNYVKSEDYLYSLGVPKDNINTIQKVKIHKYPYERFLFDDLGIENNMIIPTSKLIGSNVYGNIGFYWFDLVRWSLEKQPSGVSPNFKPERIRKCLSYLKKLGWERWNQSYQTSDIGELYFSSLEDEEGHIVGYMHEGGNGGGRHRVFTAKACGVEYIRAARVEQFRLNAQKVHYYQKIRDIEGNIKDIVTVSEIFKKKHIDHTDTKDNWRVYIINEDEYYNMDLGDLFVDYEDQLITVKDFKRYMLTLEHIYHTLLQVMVLAREIKNKHWLLKIYPKQLAKNKVDQTHIIHAYDEGFLTQDESVMKDIKAALFYHYKQLQK